MFDAVVEYLLIAHIQNLQFPFETNKNLGCLPLKIMLRYLGRTPTWYLRESLSLYLFLLDIGHYDTELYSISFQSSCEISKKPEIGIAHLYTYSATHLGSRQGDDRKEPFLFITLCDYIEISDFFFLISSY